MKVSISKVTRMKNHPHTAGDFRVISDHHRGTGRGDMTTKVTVFE